MKAKTITLAAAIMALAVQADSFKAGFARTDITPPLGVPISGYFGYRPAEKVLDPLEATCVAFSDGVTTALVYTVDNLHVSDDIIARAWDAIAKSTGVSRDTVYIASTHIHTGAATEKRYYLTGLSGKAEADAMRLISIANEILVTRLADAGRMACEDLAPASLSIARGTCPGISFIRIFRMKDGGTRTNPGVNNPDIASPVGTPDETLQLVRIAREGRPEIAIVNFQTHPDVIGGRNISADWPGFARRFIERAMDGRVFCAFFNGAQGDTNHINVHPIPGQETKKGYAHSRKMGLKVAGAALAAWEDCVPVPAGKVAGRVRTVRVAANVPDPKDLPLARKYKAAHEAGRHKEIPYTGMEYTTVVAEASRILKLEHGPDFFEMPVSTISIGRSLAFAGFPGEPFTQLGRDVKARSPYAMTIPCCIVNGSWGYLPTREVFAFGGYESRSSMFRPGVGEILSDALSEDLRALHAQAGE